MHRFIRNSIITVLAVTTLFLTIPFCPEAETGLSGKIVFHNYSSYDNADSRLYIYDFKTDALKCISENWTNVKNPMNANFGKDGQSIVFMGQVDDEWDIFEYTNGALEPVNLTKGNGLDDEDPQYDPSGKNIIFKQSNPSGKGTRIVKYNRSKKKLTVLIKGRSEKSMPYYSKNGKQIYYVEGLGKKMSIYVAGKNGKNKKLLYQKDGVQSYYPIVSDNGKYLYFSRGYSKKNRVDQIIRYNLKTGKAKSLKCNSKYFDCSDTCCVSSKYIIISCSKEEGTGGYDLYLVNTRSGKMTNLNTFNSKINTPLEELGCDYFE